MQHVMIDLETFGTRPGCVLRSIGMVTFELGSEEIGEKFYANFTEEDQLEVGCHKDPSTIAWWDRQPKETQNQLLINQKNFIEVAQEMTVFIKKNRAKYVWSQGSNFDTVLLEHSFRLFNHKTPWLFYNTRDTRTMYHTHGFDTKTLRREGTYHNALNDAEYQVKCVQAAYKNRIVL